MLAVSVTDDAIPEIEYAHLSTDETDPPKVCAVPSPPPLPHADALETPVSEAISAALEMTTPAQARARLLNDVSNMGKVKSDTSRIAQTGKIASLLGDLKAWFSLSWVTFEGDCLK